VNHLIEFAAAIDIDPSKLRAMYRVAKVFPSARRVPDVSWSVYSALAAKAAAGEGVKGVPADMWVDSFRAQRSRWPEYVDVREALGQKARTSQEIITKATTATKVAVVTELIQTNEEVRAAVAELMNPSLDGESPSSVALSFTPQVRGVEDALNRTLSILTEARENVDIISASSSMEHIAMLAGHVSREAKALAEILLLDPSKA
jgi:hypothetical protein